MPQALYQYLAEELFQSASARCETHLLTLALVPDLSPRSCSARLRNGSRRRTRQARDLGFSPATAPVSFTRCFVSFCSRSSREEPGAEARVREPVVSKFVDGTGIDRLNWYCDSIFSISWIRSSTASFKPLGQKWTARDRCQRSRPRLRRHPCVRTASRRGRRGRGCAPRGSTQLRQSRSPSRARDVSPPRPRTTITTRRDHWPQQASCWPPSLRPKQRSKRHLSSAHDDRDEAEALHGLALARSSGSDRRDGGG